MSKTLSIVIPVYNPNMERFAHCIDSIRSQFDPEEMELIIVDDVSPTKEYLALLQQWRMEFKLIVNEKNLRQGMSRQKGIDEAEGKYITFMDQDDIFIPESLPQVISRLKELPEDNLQYRTLTIVEGSVNGPGYARYFDDQLHGNYFNIDKLKEYKIHFSDRLKESSEDTFFMAMIAMVLQKFELENPSLLIEDQFPSYVWFLWPDSVSHKEENEGPNALSYFERTSEDYYISHILTMEYYRDNFSDHKDDPRNDEFLLARCMFLVVMSYLNMEEFDYMYPDRDATIFRKATFDFMKWLIEFMHMTVDEITEEVRTHPQYYSESIVRHIERLGPICPAKSIYYFLEETKEYM